MLLLEQFFDVKHLVAGKFAEADLGVRWQFGKVALDLLRKRRPQAVDADQLALAISASADRRGRLLGALLAAGDLAAVLDEVLLFLEVLPVTLLIGKLLIRKLLTGMDVIKLEFLAVGRLGHGRLQKKSRGLARSSPPRGVTTKIPDRLNWFRTRRSYN